MATVRPTKKKGSYRVEFCITRDGKRHRYSETVKVPTMAEARKLADEMEKTMRAATMQEGKSLSATWWQNQADRIMGILGHDPVFQIDVRVREIAVAWLESKEGTAKTTFQKCEQHFEFFQQDSDFWQKPITLVKPFDVEEQLTRFSLGRSASTVGVLRASLNGLFKIAVDRELIDRNPVHRAAKGQGESKGGYDRKPFSFQDVVKLRAFLGDSSNCGLVGMNKEEFKEWRIMMEASLRGAVRITDTSQLKSDDLSWVGDVLFLDYKADKTDALVSLPCSDLLSELVEGREGFICPTLAKSRHQGRNGLSAVWIRIQEKAGVDAEREKTASKKMMPTKSFHSFRHTCPSWMLAAGVPEKTVIQVTGHASEKILNKHYVHQIRESMKSTKETMDNFERENLKSL